MLVRPILLLASCLGMLIGIQTVSQANPPAALEVQPLVISSVYSINADGSGKKKIRGSFSTAGTWSPDGSKVAYSHSKRIGAKEAVYTANASGSARKRITKKRTITIDSISWTAAGDQVAYSYGGGGAGPEIAVVGADGKGSRKLIEKSRRSIGNVAWSPSGDAVAFTSCGEVCDLYSIANDGTNKRRVAKKAAINNPVWSTDGSQIAFVDYQSIDDKTTTVPVVNKDGSGKRRLLKMPKKARPSRFLALDITPDFKKVVFVVMRFRKNLYAGYDIYTMNVDGSGQKKILKNRRVERIFNIMWSPNGEKILFDSVFSFGG